MTCTSALVAVALLAPQPLPARLDVVAREYFQSNHLPAMSVAVMVNGRMAYARGFGWLDPDRKRRTTTESVFRLASVSKPVTSSITLRLWEQGKLPLDQDLRPIVPEMPSHFSVTLGQVLSNTSGIRGYKQSGHDPSRVQYRHYPRASGALRLFSVEPLVHPPGTAFHYSTQGFTVAAAAAEAVTGKPFAVLVRELAGKPTGAYSLAVEDRRIPNPHRADLFARVVDENVPVRPDDISWKGGGGGHGGFGTRPGSVGVGVRIRQDRQAGDPRPSMDQGEHPRPGPGFLRIGLGYRRMEGRAPGRALRWAARGEEPFARPTGPRGGGGRAYEPKPQSAPNARSGLGRASARVCWGAR